MVVTYVIRLTHDNFILKVALVGRRMERSLPLHRLRFAVGNWEIYAMDVQMEMPQ